jgi:4-amino-4-deoxy-L-arabinose transferase-like glycosyltransferase
MFNKKTVFALIFLLLAFRLPDLNIPLSYDEGIYAYIGQVVIPSGRLPYAAVFDQKPILVYLPYLISNLFGYGPLAVRIAGWLFAGLTIFALFYLLSKYFGLAAAFVGIFLELWLGNSPSFEGQFNMLSEQLVKLPLILFIIWFLGFKKPANLKYWFIGGLLFSWLFLTKQTYVIILLAFIPILPRLIKSFFSLAFGILIIPAVVLLIYSMNHQLFWLWLGTFGYNLQYYVNGVRPDFPIWLSLLINRLQWLYPWLLITPFIMWRLLKKAVKYGNISFILSLYLAVGILNIWSAGSRFFLHYFLLIAFPLMILLAVAGGAVLDKYLSVKSQKIIVYSLLIIMFFGKLWVFSSKNFPAPDKTVFYGEDQNQINSVISKYNLSGEILFTGYTNIFYFLYRLPLPVGNTIISELPFWDAHSLFFNNFVSEFSQKPPRFIVIEKSNELLKDNNFQKLVSRYRLIRETSDLDFYQL